MRELSNSHDDWGLDEIRERDIRIADELFNLLSQWGLYQSETEESRQLIPIPEDKLSNYQQFIKIFNKDDSDETRQMFLTMM